MRYLLLFIFFYGTISGYSQGCSDAGFCTMGAMKPDQRFSKKVSIHLRSVELSHYIGVTKFNDVIQVVTADASISIGKQSNLQIKLPYSRTYGDLATIGGVSDISLSFSRNIINTEKFQVNGTLGSKIPTTDANVKVDGRPLPMYYQPSLGTYDFVAGVSLINRHWLVAFGYQQALNQIDNNFFWGQWAATEKFEIAKTYPVSNYLKRGKDVMFRLERNWRFSRLNFYTGLLPIYRITEDERTKANTDIREMIDGSDGLALTVLAGGGYRFSVRSGIKFLFGKKIVQRIAPNADGLSREYVNSISYEYRF